MLTIILISAYILGAILTGLFFIKPMELSKFDTVWFTILWPIAIILRLVYFLEKHK